MTEIASPQVVRSALRPQEANRRQIPGSAPISEDIYEGTHRQVTAATRAILEIKNLTNSFTLPPDSAEMLVGLLQFYGLCERLVAEDPAATREMHYHIDNHLDALAIREAALTTARAGGLKDEEIDWTVLMLWMDEAFIRLRDRVPAGEFYRWADLNGGVQAFAEFSMFPLKRHILHTPSC